MCTAFLVNEAESQRQGWGWRFPNGPFAQGRSFISSAISPLPLATCWFSCLAAPPIDCFTNKLARGAQTVFAKQSLCSPIRRKSAKGLPSEAEISALWLWKVVNLCKWAVLFYWRCLLLNDSWTWGRNCILDFHVFTNFGFCACSISAHTALVKAASHR